MEAILLRYKEITRWALLLQAPLLCPRPDSIRPIFFMLILSLFSFCMKSQSGSLLVLTPEAALGGAAWYLKPCCFWWDALPGRSSRRLPFCYHHVEILFCFIFLHSPPLPDAPVKKKKKRQEINWPQNFYYFCIVSSPDYCFQLPVVQWCGALALEGCVWPHCTCQSPAGQEPAATPCSMSFSPKPSSPPTLAQYGRKSNYSVVKRAWGFFLTLLVKEEVKTKRR